MLDTQTDAPRNEGGKTKRNGGVKKERTDVFLWLAGGHPPSHNELTRERAGGRGGAMGRHGGKEGAAGEECVGR